MYLSTRMCPSMLTSQQSFVYTSTQQHPLLAQNSTLDSTSTLSGSINNCCTLADGRHIVHSHFGNLRPQVSRAHARWSFHELVGYHRASCTHHFANTRASSTIIDITYFSTLHFTDASSHVTVTMTMITGSVSSLCTKL